MLFWKKESEKETIKKYFLFLLNPIIGVVYSFRRMNTRSSYIILFLFFVLFGVSFSVPSMFQPIKGIVYLDGMYHRADFERISHISWSSLGSILDSTIKVEKTEVAEKDIFAVIIKFLVSRVTDNYHMFFMVISIIFAFFCLKTYQFFLRDENYKNEYVCYALTFLFLSIQIFQINGVRFYTAAWIALYIIFKVWLDGDKRFIFLLLLTPLIHRAYFFLLLIVGVAYFFKHYNRFWVVMFILSFIFSEVVMAYLVTYIDYLPGNFVRWSTGYIEEEKINLLETSRFYGVFSLAVKYFKYLLVILLMLNSQKIRRNDKTRDLYDFLLVLLVFTNFTMPISQLGSRFAMLAYPLIAYIWLINLKQKYQIVFYIMPFVYFYKVFYLDLNLYLSVLETSFFYYPPIISIYKYMVLPI